MLPTKLKSPQHLFIAPESLQKLAAGLAQRSVTEPKRPSRGATTMCPRISILPSTSFAASRPPRDAWEIQS